MGDHEGHGLRALGVGTQPGLLVDHQLRRMAELEMVTRCSSLGQVPLAVEPASCDLHLSDEGYRLRASFIPGSGTVAEVASAVSEYALDLSQPVVLEPGYVYLFRLQESLRLPARVKGRANPKSSTGRVDVFSRVLCDNHSRFDDVPSAYSGGLWVEVFPRTFPIRVAADVALVQLRLFADDRVPADSSTTVLVGGATAGGEASLITMSVGLEGSEADPIGYQALRHTPVLDLVNYPSAAVEDFWRPIRPHECRGPGGLLILEPEAFYLFGSHERMAMPPGVAGDMVPVDPSLGELRTHYAGFFDPGFGWNVDNGAQAVLEVRAHDVPFGIRHGQPLFGIALEQTSSEPEASYDVKGTSNYRGQNLAHAKYFRREA